ncbi:aromatic-ring hydroxylase C-terminal domain-containing protein [Saccharothrix syringae]|uniref:aromatic-ring hydroxylase C-terminal domain-containing protein n=1 Tax=Saccharothrix syringae TaxID=103733 RepID=UPI000527F488|nr:hypothetical protein [Saccharothrix syringae]
MEEVARTPRALPAGADRGVVGRRLPPVEVGTGRGRGVLLDLADDAGLRRAAAGWADRVDVVTGAPAGGPLTGLAAVLVRPDGHVAWVAEAPGGDPGEALRRWFGAPHNSNAEV